MINIQEKCFFYVSISFTSFCEEISVQFLVFILIEPKSCWMIVARDGELVKKIKIPEFPIFCSNKGSKTKKTIKK